MRKFTVVLLLTCIVTGLMLGLKKSDPPGKQMQVFANAFLETLDAEQKEIALMPYDSPKRVDWHFIPKKTRKGLVLSDMNEAQRTAALRLVRAALSEAGYDKTSKIMMLEGVLREMEGEDRNWARDPEMYYVTLFGQPSESGAWGLSFEGHHVSLNFVCRNGEVVDSTPQFFASNPSIVKSEVSGPLGKGTRVLRSEETLAFRLINELNPDQLKQAMIAEEAPAEIRFAGEVQAQVGEPEGISFSDLKAKQQALLKQLVDVYVGAVADPIAKERRELIRKAGWQNVHFAWAGALKPGVGHYYRVRGQDFLIEFVNTQADPAGNPANHIHCVWRDLTGDFDLSN
ncbi:DUF3500 domain-containing protein [Rubripirellula sp.]|jgi:hypothetical protein|nr:DUF3500 domain-containing protein [Rubripirellula sp.]